MPINVIPRQRKNTMWWACTARHEGGYMIPDPDGTEWLFFPSIGNARAVLARFGFTASFPDDPQPQEIAA